MKSLNFKYDGNGEKLDSSILFERFLTAVEQGQPGEFSGVFSYSDLHASFLKNEKSYLELIASIQKTQAARYSISLQFPLQGSEEEARSHLREAFEEIARHMDKNGPVMGAYLWTSPDQQRTRRAHSIIFVGYRQNPLGETEALLYIDTNQPGRVLELETDPKIEFDSLPIRYDQLLLMDVGSQTLWQPYLLQ
jgi:hypothetical protein